MFTDYPHINSLQDDKPNFLIKSLLNKTVLQKEFFVLDFLAKQGFTPQVVDFDGQSFQEEYLTGREINQIDLTITNIKKLALILRRLHTLVIPDEVKHYLDNSFLRHGLYQPILIVQTIMKKSLPMVVKNYSTLLTNIAQHIKTRLDRINYPINLIHGDLSRHNILLQNNNIFLIDWSDCRLDIPSCDVAQLFYLLDFDQQQEELFLKNYQMDYLDQQLLIFHKILLLLYDLANLTIKKQVLEETKIDKLNLACRLFYD